jgi:hypothetical protein
LNEAADVRLWHKADISRLSSNVRFSLYGRVADGVGLSGTILLVAVVVLLILPLLAVLRPAVQEQGYA